MSRCVLMLLPVAALACGRAPEPEWLRITKLAVPSSPREVGCSTVGRNAGGGISDLVLFTGGLQQYVEASGDVPVRVALLAAARREREAWSLDFEGGRQASSPGEFRLSGDDAGDGVFPAFRPDAEGWFVAYSTAFRLPVPVLGELMLKSRMEAAQLAGQLDGDRLTGAPLLLTGYYSEGELHSMVEQVLAACTAGKARNICAIIERETGGMPEKALESIVTLMGGADTALTDGRAEVCGEPASQACNAVSVCLQVELSATRVVP